MKYCQFQFAGEKGALVFALSVVIGQLFWLQGAYSASLPDFTELVEDYAGTVVNIATVQKSTSSERARGSRRGEAPEIFRYFFGEGIEPPRQQRESLGSGFIISGDGYVLTNAHVVKGADEIIVRLNDRREFVAELIGADQRSDLALLQIEADNLPVVELGKSKNVKVGEWVLAIGSPFGFDYSVTAGIVSAIGRSLPRDNYVPFIQTDVAINPGNSGGPLFNLDGEVIGINSQIYSRTGGFMGLSFAIPIDVAMEVVEQLKSQGFVDRGWLGVLIQEVSRGLAESFGLEKSAGALVSKVMPESPADKAGLKAGDVILKFNGKEIEEASDLPPLVGRTEVGSEVMVEIMRNGKVINKKITISVLPEDSPRQSKTSKSNEQSEKNRLAIIVSNLSDSQMSQWDIDYGVLVNTVYAGPAQEAGLRSGDVITELNNQSVKDVKTFERIVEDLDDGKTVPMLVNRRGNPMFLPLRVTD